MGSSLVSVAENLEDFKAILNWHKRHSGVKLTVLALSLDVISFRQKENIKVIHIWDLLDMEDLLDRAYIDSNLLTENWINQFKYSKYYDFDVASQHRLHNELFNHSVACLYLIKKIVCLFKKERWIYLAPSLSLIFHGPFFPNAQEKNRNNLLFKSLILEIFINNNIKIRFIPSFGYWKLKILPLFLQHHFNICIFTDIFSYFKPLIKGYVKLDSQLKKLPKKNFFMLTSGWGRDLSRIFSLQKFITETKKGQISNLNIIWRIAKYKKDLKDLEQTDDFSKIIVYERISKGVSYGPSLHIFKLSFLLKYFKIFLVKIFKNRRDFILKNGSNIHELFNYKSFQYNLFFNLFFIYRLAFLTNELIGKILAHQSFKFFLGSDSGGVVARMELLRIKRSKLISLSTPHGYQAYSMPVYNYLADKVLTYGKATAEILEKTGIEKKKIFTIGSSHFFNNRIKVINQNFVNIVIGSRSWGGLWSNYSSKHNLYNDQLSKLLDKLLINKSYNIVIKSHPNGDYFEYYDQLVLEKNNPRLTHIKKGWKVEQFNEICDILICLGECPSLFISALHLQIPIVFITKTMTKTQAKLHYNFKDCAIVAEDYERACKEINKIVGDSSYRQLILQKQFNMYKNFSSSHFPEQELVKLIKKNFTS